MDRIVTKQIACTGGLISTMDLLQQGAAAPGSAIQLSNFEPDSEGGYTRILGYTKYSTTEVPGTGSVLGVAVLGQGVLACRGADVYYGTGMGWTKINGTDNRTGAGYYRNQKYIFGGEERVALVDGHNRPFSIKMDGTGYTLLSNAPQGAEYVIEFRNRLWFAKDNILTASAPLQDNNYLAGDGATEYNLSDKITGISHFRDRLIIFCQNRILRLTGQSRQDFRIDPITENLGCQYPETIQEIAGDVAFLSQDGIRLVSGTERSNDFNLEAVSDKVYPIIQKLLKNHARIIAYTVRAKGQYRLAVPRPASPDPSIPSGLIATVKRSESEGVNWEFCTTQNYYGCVWDSNFKDSGEEFVIFGCSDGYIRRAESGNSFDGAAIRAVYQTPHLTMDDPSVRKVFRKLKVFVRAENTYSFDGSLILDFGRDRVIQPSKITLQRAQAGSGAIYDSPTSLYDLSTYSVALLPPVTETMLVGAGMAGSFLFESEAAVAPFTLSALAIDLSPGGRR